MILVILLYTGMGENSVYGSVHLLVIGDGALFVFIITCLFYVSLGILTELIHCMVLMCMVLFAKFSDALSLVYVFH